MTHASPRPYVCNNSLCRGCVTGKQLENLRNQLEDPHKKGVYNFDMLDGYEGDENGNLGDEPELQAKVRRVVEQGFIDPEDWKGVSVLLVEILSLLTQSFRILR